MRKSLLIAALVSVPALGWAQAKDEGLSVLGLDISGYIDASYNNLSRRNIFTSGAPNRVFDWNEDGFALQQFAVTAAKQPKEGFGGLLNVTIGRDADVIAAYKTAPQKGGLCNVATGFNADGSSCDRDHVDVTQGFLQFATGALTVIAGKYVTLAGAEVINSPTNTNFSRSILFGYAIPFSHTGVRGTYAVNDSLSFMLGANQGWDAIKDTNGSKTLEIGALFSPSELITLGAQAYFGKERIAGLADTGPEGQRSLFDTVLTLNATDKLTFVFNFDYGTQDNTPAVTPLGASTSTWSGWAAYAVYQFTPQWRLSLRGEYFDDEDGYRTGVVQKWKEATLTLAWLPTKAIEVRGEVRGDRSNVASFVDSDGGTHKNMRSYGVQALYKF